DYDDAIPFRDRPKRGSFTSRTRRTRFDRVVEMSAGVIAGNRYLASLAPDARVLIAPSPVPHEVPIREHQPTDRLRVGWIGLGKNLVNLEVVTGALSALRDVVTLVVVSNEPFSHPE